MYAVGRVHFFPSSSYVVVCVLLVGACGTSDSPECTTSTDCSAGQICSEGRCVTAPTDSGASSDADLSDTGASSDAGLSSDSSDASHSLPLGAPCTDDVDCAGGVCLPDELGGFCSLVCTRTGDCIALTEVDTACSAWPTDSNGDTIADTVSPTCLPVPGGSFPSAHACDGDDQCASRTCQEGQCTDVCGADGDCRVGQICTSLTRAGASGATFMGCGYSELGDATRIERVDLGVMTLAAGVDGSVDCAVPPDTVSITLMAHRTGGDPLELTFSNVIDPRDTTLYEASEILALRDQAERWLPVDRGSTITMLVPNSTPDRIAFPGGTYQWTVTPIPRFDPDPGMTTVELSALIKRAPGRSVTSGTLDLNIFLVGVGVSAAAAGTDSRVQGALARLSSILASAGISLGTVSYFDITGADATRYQIIDSTEGPDSELAGLFRLSAGRTGRALNIFLVRALDAGTTSGARALGIAGGVPGPVGIHGTEHSGIASSFDPTVVGAGVTGSQVVGQILAHQIGHYLGLFHSTEQLRPCGPGEDPSMVACSPFGAGDTLEDTSLGDSTNLMYWSIVGDGTNDMISSGQRFVLLRSALVGP